MTTAAEKAKEAAEKAKAKAPAKPKAKAAAKPKADGEKGAARPRRHDYGINDAATIVMAMEEEKVPALRGDLEADYRLLALPETKTVADYFAKEGDRASLRRLMRRGIIQLKDGDGNLYPREYTKPEPKAKAEPAAKAAEKATA